VNSLTGNMLNAVSKLVVTYKDALDDEIFKDKLGEHSPKSLGRTAKERRPGSMGYAEAMVLIYNGRKKNNANRLLMNKLYSKDFSIIDIEEDYSEDEPYDAIYPEDDTIEDTTAESVEEIEDTNYE